MIVRIVVVIGVMRIGASFGIVTLVLSRRGMMVRMGIFTLAHLNVIVIELLHQSKTLSRLVATVTNTSVLVLMYFTVLVLLMSTIGVLASTLLLGNERSKIHL